MGEIYDKNQNRNIVDNTSDSILENVKGMIGLIEDTSFDRDIVLHINSVLMILNQMGVGPQDNFIIKGSDETWSDFIPETQDIEAVKTYLYLKVKMVFDPPISSIVKDAMSQAISELEWRLNFNAEKEKR